MGRGSLKPVRICALKINTAHHSKKINRVHRVSSGSNNRSRIAFCVLLPLISNCLIAETPSISRQFVHGVVVSAEGKPVAGAAVEVRDLRGIQIGASSTDTAGKFEIPAAATPGEYTILAAKESLLRDERMVLNRQDRDITIALPASLDVAPEPPQDTVSAAQLSARSKTWKYLKSADRQFEKQNLAEAEIEVDRALNVDPACAAAFTMRAFLRLAEKDPAGALENAKRAILIDPYAADSFVALAMADNARKEFQSAEEAAAHALGIRPDSFQGRLELAKSFYGQGRFVVALWELDLLHLDFPDVHLVRGNVLMGLDRRLEAAVEFETFLEEAPLDSRNQRIRDIIAAVYPNIPAAAGHR
jgi:tetratricopeptide (TPR) repeat protein